jgi:hypothetical protein
VLRLTSNTPRLYDFRNLHKRTREYLYWPRSFSRAEITDAALT